jgi:hypothetical protein
MNIIIQKGRTSVSRLYVGEGVMVDRIPIVIVAT